MLQRSYAFHPIYQPHLMPLPRTQPPTPQPANPSRIKRKVKKRTVKKKPVKRKVKIYRKSVAPKYFR